MFRTTTKITQMIDVPCSFISLSPQETRATGAALADRLLKTDMVLLLGMLGAGKSELARGLAEALGAPHWRGSPTFNLIHEYRTDPPIAHLDLYRLQASDVDELGLDDYVNRGTVLVVEWPDRAWEQLSSLTVNRTFVVRMEYEGQDHRRISIEAYNNVELPRLGETA